MATVSLQAVYDQARRLLEGGDTERSIAVAQHILAYYPHNLEAQRILGEAFLASRRPDQAQASFQTVLHADPENIPAYVGLGISHERQGRIEQAIAAFEHALEIKPDMPELRSQLLRLYTDTWGSESAQLRLSRAGLARLYAKGHMLPQAVQEFRSVIAEQPDRYDARVGLAEVLWRNGQDDAAITVGEDILAEHPNTLKANLLLGYLLLSMGDARGQQYWDAAAAIDPYHSVARALFEQLPESATAEPTLPAWDEQHWLTERADQERASREQEETQQPAEPVAAVAAAPAAASLDDELFGASWMSAIETPSAPPAPAEPVAASPADDDFLASLLSFDDEPGAQSDDPRATVRLAPFSLDDVSPAGADATIAPEALASEPEETISPAPSVEETAEPALSPFSLSDLGLSDDEIAGLDSLGGAPAEPQDEAPAAPAPSVDETAEPSLSPFSLSDLGLSDDEIAGLDSLGGQSPAAAVEDPALSDDEPTLTPFSLSDLGLSDDEIAGLDTIGAQPAAPERESSRAAPAPASQTKSPSDTPADEWVDEADLDAELIPFSLDDLDINAGGAASFDLGSLPSSLQPFSLEDMGEMPSAPQQGQPAPLSVPDDEEPAGEPAAYSWQEPSSKPSTDFLRDAGRSEQPTGRSIFAKLRQRHSELPPVEPPPLTPVADHETDMSLFSHDDISLRDDTEAGHPAAPSATAETPAPAASVDEAATEPSLSPFSLSDLGLSPEEIASLGLEDTTPPPAEEPSSAVAAAPEPQADVTAPAPAAPVEEPAAEPSLSPFSLSDLGLSDDEIASLGLDQTGAEVTGADATAQSADASADPDLVPFSLDDFGLDDPSSFNADAMSTELKLTEDELSGMDLGSLGAAASGGASTVDTGDPALDGLITLGQRQGFVDLTDIIAAVQNPEEESERIEEIGLVLHRAGIEIRDGDEVIDMDEEVEDVDAIAPFDDASDAMFDEDEAPAPQQAPSVDSSTSDEPDMTPFSLSDLGLSPEEIAALGLSEGEAAPAEPAVAEAPIAAEIPTPAPSVDAPAPSVDVPASGEPDMTPFSLSDLGLSPEEIAALGLSEGDAGTTAPEPVAAEAPVAVEPPAQPVDAPAPSVDAPSSDEPDMTPFSLSDLGLSPEEIAALGLAEGDVGALAPEPVVAEEAPVAHETPAPAEAPAASDEPDMTPFSLSDLGLSPEEIAALGLAEGDVGTLAPEPAAEAQAAPAPVAAKEQEEAAAPAAEIPVEAADTSTQPTDAPAQSVDVSTSDEPDMAPFSLSDLGLTPEEIAAFELEQASGAADAQSAAGSDDLETSPFSLDDLGLTAEEIEALDLPSVEPAAATEAVEEADEFDFIAAEAKLGQSGPVRAQPGQPRPPREEEPPPPVSPEDLAFTPESLDALDSIWPPLSAVEAAPTSPPAAKAPEQPAQRPSTIERLPARGESSRPSREAPARSAEPPARSPEPQRREPAPAAAPANRAGPSWKPRQQQSFVPTGDEQLDAFLNQLDAEPDNDHLRLAIARTSGKSGHLDLALFQYKALIRAGSDLDDVVGDIQDLIDEHEEARDLQRLYRVLGDAYSKQNRFRDAVEAYSWTFGK